MATDSVPQQGVVEVNALYLRDHESDPEHAATQVVEEDVLTVDVEGVGLYTLMWTPTAVADSAHGFTLGDGLLGEVERPEGLALAMGFALSEGLISSLAEILSLSVCADNPKVVKVQLHAPENVQPHRKNVVINSSCGICGPKEIVEDNAFGLRAVDTSFSLQRSDLSRLMKLMRAEQKLFDETGGSHAAAIFDSDAEILVVAEDLGRHNALDKAIGTVLLARGNLTGCGVMLSSRLSLEMVVKAVRAGLEIMLAVSAPTSLATEVAQRFGVTLCGFVRAKRATVYTHPERVL